MHLATRHAVEQVTGPGIHVLPELCHLTGVQRPLGRRSDGRGAPDCPCGHHRQDGAHDTSAAHISSLSKCCSTAQQYGTVARDLNILMPLMTPASQTSTELPVPAAAPRDGQQPESGRRIPAATYRLQFHAGFTFADATASWPTSRAGRHGLLLLVVPEGGRRQPARLRRRGSDRASTRTSAPKTTSGAGRRRCRRAAWGTCSTWCPTTWASRSPRIRWWLDVLENGPSSRYAAFFDIEWHPVKPELADKVLLPDPRGSVRRGAGARRTDLTLRTTTARSAVRYYENRAADRAAIPTRVILRHGLDVLAARACRRRARRRRAARAS